MWNKTHWPIENNYKDQYSMRLSTSASCTLNHIRFTIDSQKIKNKNKTIIHFTTSINLKIHVFFIKKKKRLHFLISFSFIVWSIFAPMETKENIEYAHGPPYLFFLSLEHSQQMWDMCQMLNIWHISHTKPSLIPFIRCCKCYIFCNLL